MQTKAYLEASTSGNECLGFTLLVGEQVRESSLQELVKAMNGGSEHIVDESKQVHKICICARDANDIVEKFDAVSEWTNATLLGVRAKWRFSCEKI